VSTLRFFAENGKVWMADGPRDVRLTDAQVDHLLDIFEECDATGIFLRLYDVQRKALGEDFIPRSHLRLVSDNTAQQTVRSMLEASVEELTRSRGLPNNQCAAASSAAVPSHGADL
jgi:flagellar motor component MotA